MKKYSIGIDLGGTLIKIGLVADEKVNTLVRLDAHSANGLGFALAPLTEVVRKLVSDAGIDGFTGIGLAFPGLADPDSSRVLSTNAKYDDATTIDLAAYFRETFGGDFHIDNDARMALIGEWRYGAGRGSDDLAMMTIGTGIGGAAMIGGRLLRGRHCQAGCLGGHFTVDIDGRRCSCGNIGCAEAMASSFFLDKIIREDCDVNEQFLASHIPFDFRKLFALAADGDPVAVRVREKCMTVWAVSAVNLIHAYDPEAVIIGGGVMGSAGVILPFVREYVNRHAWTPWGRVKIEAAELGDSAAVLGAAWCVSQKNENNAI